jgi:hypothetical protein
MKNKLTVLGIPKRRATRRMTDKEMMLKGRRLLDAHGLRDWRFDVQNLHNLSLYPCECHGICKIETKVIAIDWRVGREFRQTVLHEIAHALLGRPGHGERWLAIADKIGCTFAHLLPYAIDNDKARGSLHETS